jgi:cytochrome c551/c552
MSPRRTLAVLLIGAGACAGALSDREAAGAAAASPETGKRIFADKQCARCHTPRGEQGAGPALEEIRQPQGALELAGRLWNHLPGMLAALVRAGSEWPQINVVEMADLMAFLQADAARDPAPDLSRGQVTLIRKGCLKCHQFRREGGRIEPDLATPRADYASPAGWAATMWTHTPRMAAMAERQGIPYPRFSGDEMGNLLAFLRSAAVAAPAGGSGPAPNR